MTPETPAISVPYPWHTCSSATTQRVKNNKIMLFLDATSLYSKYFLLVLGWLLPSTISLKLPDNLEVSIIIQLQNPETYPGIKRQMAANFPTSIKRGQKNFDWESPRSSDTDRQILVQISCYSTSDVDVQICPVFSCPHDFQRAFYHFTFAILKCSTLPLPTKSLPFFTYIGGVAGPFVLCVYSLT